MTGFTTAEEPAWLYDIVDEMHDDDLPGITSTDIDAREEFLAWIDANTGEAGLAHGE